MSPFSEHRDDLGTEGARPAGPVPGSGLSSSQAAGENPDPAPPPGGANTADGEGAGAVEEDLASLLAEAESKRDEYLELARRAQADFENYKKRMAAEVQAASLRGKAEVVRAIAPVVDQFELALKHEGIDSVQALAEAESNHEKAGWVLTLRNLFDALKHVGVEIDDPKGERFDPNSHEALSTVPVEGTEAGVVVEVMQKGYRFGDQLIRPARVVVSA